MTTSRKDDAPLEEECICRFCPVFDPKLHSKTIYEQAREYTKHRKNVLAAKAVVDTRPSALMLKEKLKRRIFEGSSQNAWAIDRRNELLVASIAQNLINPSQIDCWNFEYYERKCRALQNQEMEDRIQLRKATMENMIQLKRINAKTSYYPRQGLLEDWERLYRQGQKFIDYEHDWKDPYYTPAILSTKGLRPSKSSSYRFPPFKDVEYVNFRAGCGGNKNNPRSLGLTAGMEKRLEDASVV